MSSSLLHHPFIPLIVFFLPLSLPPRFVSEMALIIQTIPRVGENRYIVKVYIGGS